MTFCNLLKPQIWILFIRARIEGKIGELSYVFMKEKLNYKDFVISEYRFDQWESIKNATADFPSNYYFTNNFNNPHIANIISTRDRVIRVIMGGSISVFYKSKKNTKF